MTLEFHLCSIDGCDRPVDARGWCKAHWQRWRRHGDPLGGRTESAKVRRFFTAVVLLHDGAACLTWPFTRDSYGYGRMTRDGKQQTVARLVCEAIHGAAPSPRHEAVHSCGQGHAGCVSPLHVSWGTHAENMADMANHGTSNRGTKNPHAKLKEEDVRLIRSLGRAGFPRSEIAGLFEVSQSNVGVILRGQSWGWLA